MSMSSQPGLRAALHEHIPAHLPGRLPWPLTGRERDPEAPLVLRAEAPAGVVPLLLQLRRQPETALLPIVVALDGPEPPEGLLNPAWHAAADAVLAEGTAAGPAEAALARARRIGAAVAALPAAPAGAGRRLFLLRWLITRGPAVLVPRRDPHVAPGFGYPPLDWLAGEPAGLAAELFGLCRAGLLERGPGEAVRACPACDDTRLGLFSGEDGDLAARCLGCGAAQLAADLPGRTLWTYHLTPEGRMAALSGHLPPSAGEPGGEAPP